MRNNFHTTLSGTCISGTSARSAVTPERAVCRPHSVRPNRTPRSHLTGLLVIRAHVQAPEFSYRVPTCLEGIQLSRQQIVDECSTPQIPGLLWFYCGRK